MAQTTFDIRTTGPGLFEITAQAADFANKVIRGDGLLTLFIRHTSASLLIQENADPEVQVDLLAWLMRLVPPANDPTMRYLTHTYEGPDDMPGHIRSALLPTSLSIPVTEGRLCLGQWQGIFLFEHRDRGRHRQVVAHLSQ
ncbi:MAG: secondary thiamine-phosphate synthase enzyme YjbQ [Pseudomonadota bacterium]